MSIKTFWLIFIKILGIWLIIGSINVLSQSINAAALIFSNIDDDLLSIEIVLLWLLIIVTIGIYFLVLYVFVFKANWIIKKLNLVEGFKEDKFEINISSKSILTIASIVFGGVVFIDAFPQFFMQLYNFFIQKNSIIESPSSGWIFFYLVQSLIGYYFVFNNQIIVNFFESQITKNNKE
ncbi:MAG: hypothetical protein COW67_12265 [Flavobacteriales bacterium CG18_big_fil_WC_8_21_14_2_50_32_9]|nr:MAG: hypothetical protein COW67_12265 [Flavobacteriales bacterium CG18_big_fil_WC_8_21_14_2_50_32_9]PIZ06104.1 MAG: hypothetical protein COY57_03755 [Flavobacteriales bacterium CG_4_10_14_0_8_um_filter_32_5]